VRVEAGRADYLPDLEGRAGFGLPELDALLNGGLTRETSTLIMVSLRTGKTLLGLHFALAGLDAGEPAVYLGLRETRGQLLRRADAFALGDRLRTALEPGGGLILQHLEPVELDPDIVAADLLDLLDESGARRLVVDSITELERAVAGSTSPQRLDDYLAALLTALRARRISALFIKESRLLVTTQLELFADALSTLAENVLLLQS
jgi:circadian clock protein KaiC